MSQLQEAIEATETLAQLARRVDRTVNAVYRWGWFGVLNRFTGERIRMKMTRLPSGKWGVTAQQYRDFVQGLNERL